MSLFVILLAMVITAIETETEADESKKADFEPRPNIIFLCTDDQAQWALGAYGNREIETPHLDSLARRGAILGETTGLEGMRLATSQVIHDYFIEELPQITASSQLGLGRFSWVGA